MATNKQEPIAVFNVWVGDGGGSYKVSVAYITLDELMRDVRGAIEAGKSLLIEREFITRAEYDNDYGPEYPADVNPLLQEKS